MLFHNTKDYNLKKNTEKLFSCYQMFLFIIKNRIIIVHKGSHSRRSKPQIMTLITVTIQLKPQQNNWYLLYILTIQPTSNWRLIRSLLQRHWFFLILNMKNTNFWSNFNINYIKTTEETLLAQYIQVYKNNILIFLYCTKRVNILTLFSKLKIQRHKIIHLKMRDVFFFGNINFHMLRQLCLKYSKILVVSFIFIDIHINLYSKSFVYNEITLIR